MSNEKVITVHVVLLENEMCDATFDPDADGQAAIIKSFTKDTGPLQRHGTIAKGFVLCEIDGLPLCWTPHCDVVKRLMDGKPKVLKFLSSENYYEKQ